MAAKKKNQDNTNTNSNTKTHCSDSKSGQKSLTWRNNSYRYQFSFIILYNVYERPWFPLPLSISPASGEYITLKNNCNILHYNTKIKPKRTEIQATKPTILTHGADSHASPAARNEGS
jgi:hypothetical protein